MSFRIDRVVFAWSRMEALAGAFARVGLSTDYGGIHTNGATHFSTLGFMDGSYLEIVSVRQPGQQAPVWQRHIETDGGACAWSITVDDMHRVGSRLANLGIPLDGPRASTRRRPDGESVESEIMFIGADGMGSLHPFMVSDQTPRRNRVQVSESVRAGELEGIDSVVIAVPDVEVAAIELQRIYGAGEPVDIDSSAFPGRIVFLEGEPVSLVSPGGADDPLADLIERYGPTPCGCLIRSRDMAASQERLPLSSPGVFAKRQFAWIKFDGFDNLNIGVIAEE